MLHWCNGLFFDEDKDLIKNGKFVEKLLINFCNML